MWEAAARQKQHARGDASENVPYKTRAPFRTRPAHFQKRRVHIPRELGKRTALTPCDLYKDVTMPLRFGKFTRQHALDVDGAQKFWDTKHFAAAADAAVARNGRMFGYG